MIVHKVFFPMLRNVPLRMHDADEPMYSRDGIHWYYEGEEPTFDLVPINDLKRAADGAADGEGGVHELSSD